MLYLGSGFLYLTEDKYTQIDLLIYILRPYIHTTIHSGIYVIRNKHPEKRNNTKARTNLQQCLYNPQWPQLEGGGFNLKLV